MIRKMKRAMKRMLRGAPSEMGEGSHIDINMTEDLSVGQPRTSYISQHNAHITNITAHIDDELLRSACRGDVTSVRSLLREGAHINTQDSEGRTALYLACDLGHLAVVDELMKYGGQHITTPANNGWMPLHAASSGGDAQIIQHLLRPIRHQQQQYYAQQQQYQQQLHDYTSQQQLYYQGHFNNRGAVVDAEDSEGRTALHTAADLGHTQVLLQLLTAHPMLNKRDIDGATPLLLAATHGHQGAVKALTRAGCELDERNCEGRTALMEAVTASHTNIAQHLISCGCHVNVMDNHGYSALADAACAKDIRSVNLLLDGGADVDIQDSRGRTPLHLAILYGYNAIAQCLINANCQLNTQDMDGHTAVFLAAWDPWDKGTLPILDTLARAGADLNKSDLMGATPITKAWAHKENVITLIQHGCQVNLETQPNLQTPYGFSLVELAAMERDSRTVHALRVAGFDASVIDFSAKREKHQQEYDDLKKLFSSPLNLKDISRLTIRRHIKKHLHKKAKLLPLPTILKSYVCMKDL